MSWGTRFSVKICAYGVHDDLSSANKFYDIDLCAGLIVSWRYHSRRLYFSYAFTLRHVLLCQPRQFIHSVMDDQEHEEKVQENGSQNVTEVGGLKYLSIYSLKSAQMDVCQAYAVY